MYLSQIIPVWYTKYVLDYRNVKSSSYFVVFISSYYFVVFRRIRRLTFVTAEPSRAEANRTDCLGTRERPEASRIGAPSEASRGVAWRVAWPPPRQPSHDQIESLCVCIIISVKSYRIVSYYRISIYVFLYMYFYTYPVNIRVRG